MAKAEPVIVKIELSDETKAVIADIKRMQTTAAAAAAAAAGKVVIERRLLQGWDDGKTLSGAQWRAYIESLPAGEFATTLLALADAIDKADGTGWYAPKTEESK